MKTWMKTLSYLSLLSLVAACGSQKDNTAPQSGKEQEQASKEPVELVIHSSALTTEDKFYGEPLRKKFPNYNIKIIPSQKGTTLPELIAAGTKIDIYFHAIGTFESTMLSHGLEYDMTELIKKHNVDMSRFEPTLVDSIKQLSEGKIYSLPVYANNLVLFYNKMIFDKFGVSYPKDGMTWEETFELSKRLTRVEGDTQYIGFTHVPFITVRNNPLSIPIVDMKTNMPTINSNKSWEQFFRTFFVDAVDEGVRTKIADSLDGRAFIVNKNIAMTAYLFGTAQSLDLEKPFEWDMASLPVFKGTNAGSQMTAIHWGITNQSKNKDAAMEVLKYLTSDEFQTILANSGLLPVLKTDVTTKLLAQSTLLKNKNYKAVLYNKPASIPAKTKYDPEVISIYGNIGSQVMTGKIDLNTAMRQAEEMAKQKIAEISNK
ncbi:ABC transporter substrate-binding protein [Paenibacillus oceani]|uniref:Extracellular solute-binding protein n=1 Tax=Paenibacillus oceani TaxID=2772510 RepID=A0A927C9M3_9BACL|nr:extracellular solute-binding protein [Paenibacillus oceani]MBD2862552.1 extracellular solute-binding protein [Paenibacillus oceani]